MGKRGSIRGKLRFHIRPIQVLPLGFFVVILIGTLLLCLPVARVDTSAPFSVLDALFTATSATCVTGLVVVDTGTVYTTFGHVVILLLIQVGGLGFMSMATLLFIALRKKISLKERMVMAESLNADRLQGVVKLGIAAMKLTFGVELVGALLLSFRFIPLLGFSRGVWYSVFHSVSAFCNAGFDLMGDYASLTGFRGDFLVNVTIMALIVAGGLGFAVLADFGQKKTFCQWRLHTKVVVLGNAALIVGGALLIFLLERDNPGTLKGLPFGEQALASAFQSVTLRTAGFNTIDQLSLRDATKLVGIILMCIGASPAGTGGGVKVTTAMVVFLGVMSVIRNRPDPAIFGRRIAWGTVRRALAVIVLFLTALLVTTVVISCIEINGPAGTMGLENLLYEITSAFGTVGVSVGATAIFSAPSRILLILAMFLGRVGPLSIMLAFAGRPNGDTGIHYPEGHLMVG